jgi:hypothetical protein
MIEGTDYAGTSGISTLNCVGRKDYPGDAQWAEKGNGKIATETERHRDLGG